MDMKRYWAQYAETKALIVDTKPQSFAELKTILDAFQSPSSGDAFWPNGDGTHLADELAVAGWVVLVWFEEFHYVIENPAGEFVEYVEGDLYLRPKYKRPTEVDATE